MESMTAIYSCAAGLLLAVFLLLKKIQQQANPKLNLPPSGPLALPIIGHLYLLKRPLHRTLADMAARHGPLLLLRFGSRPILLVSSPELAEECFTINDVVFANRPFEPNRIRLTYNYTTVGSAPYGPYWRNIRRIIVGELFTPAKLNWFSSIREVPVGRLTQRLASGGRDSHIELKSKLSEMIVNFIMQPVAGKCYDWESTADAEEGRRIIWVVDEAFSLGDSSHPEDLLPFIKKLGIKRTGHNKRVLALQKEMDILLQSIVDERRRRPGRKDDVVTSKTVVDVLLSLQEADPEYYSDTVIKGIILTLLTGGIETTRSAMEMIMSLLIDNLEALYKLRAEIDSLVGHKRLLVDSDLCKLPYLNNVIKEGLRLFPGAPFLLPHQSSGDCKLNGYDIPAGTILFVNIFAINRDPNTWTEPTKFKPERFEAEEGKVCNFIPFGFGRRRCPGEAFAGRLMGLTLGTLIQCFEWEQVGGKAVDFSVSGTISIRKASPLQVMCNPRPEMGYVLSKL